MIKILKRGKLKRKKFEGIIFALPFIIGTLIFYIFPLFISIKLSFGKLKSVQGFVIQWVGLANYSKALIIDTNFIPMFLSVIQKTIVQGPLIIVFSLLLALLINKNIKLKGAFRVIYFIPFLLGTGEVMNKLLGLGLDRQGFAFADSKLLPREFLVYLGPKVIEAVESFFGIIVVVLWNSGVQMLLFLSGLQSIPISLYESAKVDGGSEWEMFWKITLPLMSPIMLLNIVYTIITFFTDISNPIVTYTQDIAFRKLNFEYAAAIGWIYFLFIILLVMAVFFAFRNNIRTSSQSGGVKENERY
ncbi:MAG: sugar ABC transporter permease [Clostridiaceae bacterium]|nr:sugar ABC transporter permease [Clostridiaceae bacterium]